MHMWAVHMGMGMGMGSAYIYQKCAEDHGVKPDTGGGWRHKAQRR